MNWDDVTIIRNPNAANTSAKETPKILKKQTLSKKEINIEKLTNNGDFYLDLVPIKISKHIIQKRQELGLTQKQLAQKINQNVKVIQDFESGKAKMDGNIIGKLNKVLCTSLKKLQD